MDNGEALQTNLSQPEPNLGCTQPDTQASTTQEPIEEQSKIPHFQPSLGPTQSNTQASTTQKPIEEQPILPPSQLIDITDTMIEKARNSTMLWGGPYEFLARQLEESKNGNDENINKKNPDFFGCTALHHAVDLGDINIIKALLGRKSNVDAKNDQGSTPLHHAANKEIAELLIDKGASIDAEGDDGQTPLYWATYWARRTQNKEVVELLIANGASPSNRCRTQ